MEPGDLSTFSGLLGDTNVCLRLRIAGLGGEELQGGGKERMAWWLSMPASMALSIVPCGQFPTNSVLSPVREVSLAPFCR